MNSVATNNSAGGALYTRINSNVNYSFEQKHSPPHLTVPSLIMCKIMDISRNVGKTCKILVGQIINLETQHFRNS